VLQAALERSNSFRRPLAVPARGRRKIAPSGRVDRPSTRAPRAPVTSGRLPGRPASVSRASHANAMAPRKSGSTP
jgi:hypothetical protein